jgi:hypothetical protein
LNFVMPATAGIQAEAAEMPGREKDSIPAKNTRE